MTESMRDTLEATFKEIEERDTSAEETPLVEEPELAVEEDDAPPDDKAVITDKKAPETPKPNEPKTPVKSPVAEKGDDKKAPAQKVVDTALANPPITWKPKAKAQWASIPDDVKKEIRKREQDALDGIKQYKEAASYGDRLSKTIQPYQPFLTARNTTPENVVKESLDLAYRLSTGNPQEKGALLRHLAKIYQADMGVPNPEQDKTALALQPLVSKIQQLEQTLQNSQMSERQRQSQTLEQQVEAFAAETDETGALKRPYFEEVKGLMAALLESGQAKQLGDAYALAVKAHPEVSLVVQSEVADVEKKKAEALERQQKAKRNNQVNFDRKPVAASKSAAEGSMRETIQSTYDRLMQNA